MSKLGESVSLHPYFKVHPGKMPEVKALLRAFVAKSETEPGSLQYGFTVNGEEIFCRESYVDAEAVLQHLQNVGPEIDLMLKLSTLSRVEVHGPATQLAKLKGPLGVFNPAWFELECGKGAYGQ